MKTIVMPTFCDERGVDKTEIKINKIRLLVLDIDGVLNSRNFFMNNGIVTISSLL